MTIDQEYIKKILEPLVNGEILTLLKYLEKLEFNGLTISDQSNNIDDKFETHLNYLCRNRIIKNNEGKSDLNSLGFIIGAMGYLAINGDIKIMKNDCVFLEKPINRSDIEKATTSVINNYTFNGDHGRVNHDSNDNSINITNNNSAILENIESLRNEINTLINSKPERIEALEIVDEIEAQFNKEKPNKSMVRALIDGLPALASIASIGSLLFSALSN